MLLLVTTSWAGELEDYSLFEGGAFQGTEAFRLRYYNVPETLSTPVNWESGGLPVVGQSNVLDYIEAVNQLDWGGGNADWSTAVRLDAVGFFQNRYVLDGVETQERQVWAEGLYGPTEDTFVDLEKIWVKRRFEHGEVTVGDVYGSFGRGFALSLTKNNDIDVDTSLRGARASLLAGDWELTALGGYTNPQQVNNENRNLALQPDDGHTVGGLRVDRYAIGPVNLGAHWVQARFEEGRGPGEAPWSSLAAPVGARVIGATAEALGVAGVDWYVEGDRFTYASEEVAALDGVEDGYAAYASATTYKGPLAIVLEGKRTYNTEYVNTFSSGYELSTGPTLEYERAITEDGSAAVNSNDLTGGRLRVDWRVGGAAASEHPRTLIPYASLAAFKDDDTAGLHFNQTPETIVHPLAGVQYLAGNIDLIVNGGYRVDQRATGEGGEDYGADHMMHADLALSFPAGPLHIEVDPSFQRFQWGVNEPQQSDYTDASLSLGAHIGEPWMVLAYTDYSNNPLIRSEGNLSETTYLAGELRWEPASTTTVKLFGGAYRAGIRCAGGQCRSLPGFSGVKMSVDHRF